MRRGAGADRGLAAFLLVEQRDQDRRVVALEKRDLDNAQRVAFGAFALEADLTLGVGRQEAREIAADDDAFLMPQRPFAQHAIGGEQLAVGRDQRGHDPSRGQSVARRPGDQRLHAGGQIDPDGVVEAPDQHVLCLTRAVDRDGHRPAARIDAIEPCRPVAPGGAPRGGEIGRSAAFQRQPRRGRIAVEACTIAFIGAD